MPTNARPQPNMNPAADKYAADALALSAAALPSLNHRLDLAYGPDPEQLLDLFLPRGGGSDLPVLIFLHGGGWTHGYKEWNGFMAPALTARGVALVSVDYRLLPHVAYPTPLHDCIAALRWVWEQGPKHGLARERIFVGGHSAGGHLAALVALRHDLIAAAGLPADVVKGVFCISATFNRRMVNEKAAPDHVPQEPFTAIAPESPLALADQARCPFDIVWGSNEHERLERTGRQMIAALETVGVPVTWAVDQGDDHFTTHLKIGDPDSEWVRRAARVMGGR